MSHLPLVFACSGCSAAGRLAYDLALELQRRGIAEMSCLAGVGAAKSHFLKQLKNREVWLIDGCPIDCAAGVFQQQSKHVDVHIQLHDYGVTKSSGVPSGRDLEQMVEAVLQQVRSPQIATSGTAAQLSADTSESSRAVGTAAGPLET